MDNAAVAVKCTGHLKVLNDTPHASQIMMN